jgi:hypothetical protein
MRCVSCNCVLTDFEATRKGVNTGEYIDMCNRCFATIADDVAVIERDDLKENGDDGSN